MILRQITALIRQKPNAVLQAALPGLILFAASLWIIQVSGWTNAHTFQYRIGDIVLTNVAVGSILGISFVGFLLLCVFLQRCLLRQADTPRHGLGKWAKAFALYPLQLFVIAAVLFCFELIVSHLPPTSFSKDVFISRIIRRLPAQWSETVHPAHLGLLINAALSLFTSVPALWITLRIGLTLPAAAMARAITPWASWRRTWPFQKGLLWLSFWVCVIAAATNAALTWQAIAPVLAAMPTGDAIENMEYAISQFGVLPATGVPYALLTFTVIRTIAFLLLFLCITAALYAMSDTKDDQA